MIDSSTTTRVFEALQVPYRRQLLLALLAANPQSDDDLDPLNRRRGDPASIGDGVDRIQLVHVHLPKLDDWGFIDWDREAGQVRKGPSWDAIAPILRLIRDHQEDMPDGW